GAPLPFSPPSTGRALRQSKLLPSEISALNGLQTHFDSGTRVEIVAQRVADEIEGEHGEHHGDSRKEHEMRRVEQVRAGVVEHGAPACGWWRHAEAQKAHGRFGKDGAGHADRGLHDDRLNDVGENVSNNHAPVACAQGSRRFHILALARRQKDRKSTRLNSSHLVSSYAVFCLKKKGNTDFLNMLERERLESKKISKTNAVTSMLD